MYTCCKFERQLITKLIELGIKYFRVKYPELAEINYLEYDYRWHVLNDRYTFVSKPFKQSNTIWLRMTPTSKNNVESIFIILPFLLKFFIEEVQFKKHPIRTILEKYIFKGHYVKEKYGEIFSFFRTLEKAFNNVEYYTETDANTRHELKSLLNLKYANLFDEALDIYSYTK